MKLTRFGGANAEQPSQLHNVRYFAATWNGPFDLYHSDHFFKSGDRAYSPKKANGFVITVEPLPTASVSPRGRQRRQNNRSPLTADSLNPASGEPATTGRSQIGSFTVSTWSARTF